jgi:hypothetical protein
VNAKTDVAPLLPLWLETFGAMDPHLLENLFQQAIRKYKWVPQVAEILEPIESAKEANVEEDWQALLQYVRDWVHPDIQFSRAPKLPAGLDHAARAAGGVLYLRECPHEELGWRKKLFIEDLQRTREIGKVAGILTGSELTTLLKQASIPIPQLAPPKQEQIQPEIKLGKPRVAPRQSTLTIEEQKEILRQKGFLQ